MPLTCNNEVFCLYATWIQVVHRKKKSQFSQLISFIFSLVWLNAHETSDSSNGAALGRCSLKITTLIFTGTDKQSWEKWLVLILKVFSLHCKKILFELWFSFPFPLFFFHLKETDRKYNEIMNRKQNKTKTEGGKENTQGSRKANYLTWEILYLLCLAFAFPITPSLLQYMGFLTLPLLILLPIPLAGEWAAVGCSAASWP